MAHCLQKQVSTWRPPSLHGSGYKCLSKRNDQKVVDVPESRDSVNVTVLGVKSGEMLHEVGIVEEVEHLPTVKLDSIDKIDSVVG